MFSLPTTNFRAFQKVSLEFATVLSKDCLANRFQGSYPKIKSVFGKRESILTTSFKKVFPFVAIFQSRFSGIKIAEHFSNLYERNDYELNDNRVNSHFTDLGELWGSLRGLEDKMSNVEAMAQLENNAQTADNLIQEIYSKLAFLQNCNPELGAEVQNLLQQNEALKQEVDQWKELLILQQIRNGGNPVVRDPKLIEKSTVTCAIKQESAPAAPASTEVKSESRPAAPGPQQGKKAKKEKDGNAPAEGAQKNKSKSGGAPAPEVSEEVDIGRLDLRIGLIKECSRHPDADSLYVEKIDVGEENVRTVISGLVKHVPLEAMQNRMVVVLCNLKPSKMRGIMSEAMVMCASSPEKVEILVPPPGTVPGDVIEVEGYVRRPDAVLNPKKKIFETVAPDLKTNDNKQATYKGATWNVPAKGVVVTESLCNVNIK